MPRICRAQSKGASKVRRRQLQLPVKGRASKRAGRSLLPAADAAEGSETESWQQAGNQLDRTKPCIQTGELTRSRVRLGRAQRTLRPQANPREPNRPGPPIYMPGGVGLTRDLVFGSQKVHVLIVFWKKNICARNKNNRSIQNLIEQNFRHKVSEFRPNPLTKALKKRRLKFFSNFGNVPGHLFCKKAKICKQ